VLLAVLVFIALASFAAMAAAEAWTLTLKREREAELLFVGEQYRRALESYWRLSPGPVKTLPTTIDQLLLDDRFPQPVMHLRRAWADPVTGEKLQLVKSGNVIVGVQSGSKDAPVKVANFPERYVHFESAASYQQWRFIFTPPRAGVRPGPPRPAR
jgi:type II secretory pathway pseudopilin PulG